MQQTGDCSSFDLREAATDIDRQHVDIRKEQSQVSDPLEE